MYTIYSIKNIKNNKEYIGSTVNYNKRCRSHLNALLGEYHTNYKLQEEFKLFGEENFEFSILAETESEEERYQLEEKYIVERKSFENGYNLTVDGRGKYVISDETREKMRRNNMGKNNPFYGKKHTEETRAKISEAASRRVGDLNPFYGKKHTEEAKAKISASWAKLKEDGWQNPQKGVPKTEEAVYNNMMAQPKRKVVVAAGKEYPSISAAAKGIGCARTTIRNRINSESFPDYYYVQQNK